MIDPKIVEQLLDLAYLAIAPGRSNGPVAVRAGLAIVKPDRAYGHPPPTLGPADLADQRGDEEILELACPHSPTFAASTPTGNAAPLLLWWWDIGTIPNGTAPGFVTGTMRVPNRSSLTAEDRPGIGG